MFSPLFKKIDCNSQSSKLTRLKSTRLNFMKRFSLEIKELFTADENQFIDTCLIKYLKDISRKKKKKKKTVIFE